MSYHVRENSNSPEIVEIIDSDDEEELDDRDRLYADVIAYAFLLCHRSNDFWIQKLGELLNAEDLRGLEVEELVRGAKDGKIRKVLYPPRQKKNGGFSEDNFLVKVRKRLFGEETRREKNIRNEKIKVRAKRKIRELAGADIRLVAAGEMDVDIELHVENNSESDSEG